MTAQRTIILLSALLVIACPLTAVAAAQVPGSNASGGQYLPALSGGGGERPPVHLPGPGSRGGSGSLESLSGDHGGGQIGWALPLLLIGSAVATIWLVVRQGRTDSGQGTRAADR
jgi:hypothetical protein